VRGIHLEHANHAFVEKLLVLKGKDFNKFWDYGRRRIATCLPYILEDKYGKDTFNSVARYGPLPDFF
jgi:hypothetical protein